MTGTDGGDPGDASPRSFDYTAAAPTYDRHRRPGGPHLQLLVDFAKAPQAKRVLELGPGTGNGTLALHEAYPCRIIGLDKSPAMLEQAQAKSAPGLWVNGDAHYIPLADGSVDFVFAVLVLHHLPGLDEVMSECHRVLGLGYAAFVTSTHSFIERHPMNAFFPSFAMVDKERFPDIETIRAAMRRAGFEDTGVEYTEGAPEPIDAAYLEKVANKFISTYSLIPEAEFQRGVERLRARLAGREALDTPMVWEAAVVWGRKT